MQQPSSVLVKTASHSMLLMTEIHVRSFSGAAIKPYVHSIVKLRHEVLRDYPYFEELNPHREMDYLRQICACKEAISVLIFNHTTLVGVAFGYPLALESQELRQPFEKQQLEIGSYYFFGDPTLLKSHRNRGIGHHFFDARESFVLQMPQFKHIAFYTPVTPSHPSDFIPMDDFWRKRGYIHHPEMQVCLSREKIDPTLQAETRLNCWIKDL